MRAPFILTFCLGLAACATPQEQCINEATRDLRVVDGLIAQIEGNIARGYALTNTQIVTQQLTMCREFRPQMPPKGAAPGTPPPPPVVDEHWCLRDVVQTVQQPVAVDLREERQKLTELRKKRTELARASEAQVAQCRAQYPR